jgi:hypothetical protein
MARHYLLSTCHPNNLNSSLPPVHLSQIYYGGYLPLLFTRAPPSLLVSPLFQILLCAIAVITTKHPGLTDVQISLRLTSPSSHKRSLSTSRATQLGKLSRQDRFLSTNDGRCHSRASLLLLLTSQNPPPRLRLSTQKNLGACDVSVSASVERARRARESKSATLGAAAASLAGRIADEHTVAGRWYESEKLLLLVLAKDSEDLRKASTNASVGLFGEGTCGWRSV